MLSKHSIEIIPNKPCYHSSDLIEFTVNGDVIEDFNFIRVRIYRIAEEEEYDICEQYFFFDLVKDNYGSYKIRIKAEYLPVGLYRIAYIELNLVEESDHNNILRFDIYEDHQISSLGFEINSSGCDQISFELVSEKINSIYLFRKNNQNSGIGDNTKALFYKAFVFCRDIHLTKRYDYDKYEIIPFESLGYYDTIEFVNKFLNIDNSQTIPYPIEDELLFHNSPGLVVVFPKIFAENLEDAGNIAEREVETLLKTFSLTRESYGLIVSCIVVDETSQNIRIYKPRYIGNLMTGDEHGENPYNNRAIVKALKKDDFLNLCISLYAEALNEKNIEIAYSRFWSILETMANKRDYSPKQIRKTYLDGTRIPGNFPINAKDKVRELVREFININLYLKSLFSENYEDIERSDEILSIWSRHRNCIVHNGGCFPDDPKKCLREKPEYRICNSAHNNVLKNYKARTIHNDPYFDLLRQTIRVILVEEALLISKSTKNIETSRLFMNLRQVPEYKFVSFPLRTSE